MNEPGKSIDLSTFIAYLLPGILVQVLLLALIDGGYLITLRGSNLPALLSMDVAKLAGLGIVATILGYFLGLLLDLYAHVVTTKFEEDCKNEGYKETIERLTDTLDGFPKDLLTGESLEKRNAFIDTMFYHYATSAQWSRQNWSWSFYEASRDLTILFLPGIFILSTYMALVISTNAGLTNPPTLALVSLVAAFTITGLAYLRPCRSLKGYRKAICKTYHKQRAYIVLGALIDLSLSKTIAQADRSDISG